MTLNETNQKLEDLYGRLEDRAKYRMVWCEDELEKRHGTFRDFVPGTNIFLREVTEVREVPKYKQWVKDAYILERITPYTDMNSNGEMIGKLGYEPLHVFNALGKQAIPSIGACRYLIEIIIEGMRSPGQYVKYKDPAADPEKWAAEQKAEIDKIMLELFGNETDVTDALAHKEGVVVPSSYKVN